jgi:RES domain-containing protein
LELLDAIDSLPRVAFEGRVWRIVREGKDPLQGYPAGARWDPGDFDVLYTACNPDGAYAEIYFHLNRAPVFPSRPYIIHTLGVTTRKTLKFADVRSLQEFEVDITSFEQPIYSRTQEIGDVAYFLGFDGLLVPSARSDCQNLVIFVDRINPNEDLRIMESEVVDWPSWRQRSSSGEG